jgi:hypothetical protein
MGVTKGSLPCQDIIGCYPASPAPRFSQQARPARKTRSKSTGWRSRFRRSSARLRKSREKLPRRRAVLRRRRVNAQAAAATAPVRKATAAPPSAIATMSPGNRPSICTPDQMNCISLTSRLHLDVGIGAMLVEGDPRLLAREQQPPFRETHFGAITICTMVSAPLGIASRHTRTGSRAPLLPKFHRRCALSL